MLLFVNSNISLGPLNLTLKIHTFKSFGHFVAILSIWFKILKSIFHSFFHLMIWSLYSKSVWTSDILYICSEIHFHLNRIYTNWPPHLFHHQIICALCTPIHFSLPHVLRLATRFPFRHRFLSRHVSLSFHFNVVTLMEPISNT